MKRYSLVFLSAFILLPVVYGQDWYTISQQNYAAVQSGLAQLNTAAVQMNQSLYAAVDEALEIYHQLRFRINTTLTDLRARYPSLTLSSDQINSIFFYDWFVGNVADGYRKSVTNNVMIPAQVVIRDILDAMTNLYFSSSSNCAIQFAPNLLKPQISVGRLSNCLLAAVPFFGGMVDTVKTVFSWTQAGVDRVSSLRNLCAPTSSNCTSKFFNDLKGQLDSVANSIYNLQNLPNTFVNPGVAWTQECVALITEDIQDAIQGIQNDVTRCAAN